jgi:hypothetical protein
VGGINMQKKCNIPTLLPIFPSDSVRSDFGLGDIAGEENYGDM